MILTDPPYVTNYRNRQGRTVDNDDNGRWLKPAFAEKRRVLKGGAFAVTMPARVRVRRLSGRENRACGAGNRDQNAPAANFADNGLFCPIVSNLLQ